MSLMRHASRIGPLGTIILLHVAFFCALQSGLQREAAQVLPKEVMVTFITPERPSESPQPQAAAPKPVPVVKKTVPPRPAPVTNTTPSPKAITTPPTEPAPAEPAATAIVAPPALPAPSVASASAQPRTVSSGIEYIKAPSPEYPAAARRMGEEGTAVLRVLVNEKGRPERAEIQKSSGSGRLDEAARQAVLRALFKPFIEDGSPVAAYAIVPIKFQLD